MGGGGVEIDSVNNAVRIMQKTSQFKRWGRRSPFLRYGIPLISFTVLDKIDDLEWEALENTKLLARTGPMDGYKPNKNFSLENELKMLREKIDIHNYEFKKITKLDGSGGKQEDS
ncbi:Kinesin like protein, putative, expressed [Zostera marina]|uniref:Kinesin like protein, putative, expressed n=1 Tax=Zostera marina TaxID=29655 RepID=A0A0K9P2Q4_ZOSMR|nr:Kinesin like protein, putative, expressed [Zostera marina]